MTRSPERGQAGDNWSSPCQSPVDSDARGLVATFGSVKLVRSSAQLSTPGFAPPVGPCEHAGYHFDTPLLAAAHIVTLVALRVPLGPRHDAKEGACARQPSPWRCTAER